MGLPLLPSTYATPAPLRAAGRRAACLLLLAGAAWPALAQPTEATPPPRLPGVNTAPGPTAPRPLARRGRPGPAATAALPLRTALAGPVITALVPARNLHHAPGAGSVAATFSEFLSATAATQGALHVFSAQGGGHVAGTATVRGNTLAFRPSHRFRAGETVQATITTAAQAASGNLEQPQVFQFTTAVGGGSGDVSVLAASPEVSVNAKPFNLTLGDVDGDGDLDLVVPNVAINAVSIRLNSGLHSGSFVAPATHAEVSVGGAPRSVVLGDVDGDGDLDLVATQDFFGTTVSLRLNNGSGAFSAPAVGAEIGVGRKPLGAALGDVDGDGDLDLLVVNNADNTVSVRLNAGLNSGHFVAPATGAQVSVGPYPLGMTLGDVDGDGDLDLLTTVFDSGLGTTVSLRLNNGSGVFAPPATRAEITVGLGPVLVVLGDLDGDGDLDLATNNYRHHSVSIRLNAGLNSGQFVAPAANGTVSTGYSPESLALGDVNADGHLDLLTANLGGNSVSVRLNNGSGAFAPPATNAEILVQSQPAGLALGDLNGDGSLDFAATNYGSGSTSVRLNRPAPDLVVASAQNISGTYNNITIVSGGVATLSGPLAAAVSLRVEPGGTLHTACHPLTGAGSFVLEAGATLSICDPGGISSLGATGAVRLAGPRSFSPEASYVYNGVAPQTTGTGLPAQVRHLGTTNANTLALTAPVSVAQVLTVGGAGNLALNGHALTLLSSSAGTALLVNSGSGLVTGNTGVMQRYIDDQGNPAGGYHHFSAPVAGSTVADLTTPGFTPRVNSAYNSSPTPSSVRPFPTVFGYNESRLANAATGISPFDKGFESPDSLTEALVPGKGYTVHLATTTLVDFTGTFTQGVRTVGGLARSAPAPAAGPADQTGWQLLGNPYPAPLDWSTVSAANRPNLEAAVYVYQSTGPYGGVFHSFVNGTGTGTGLLAAGQAFFVRVSAAGAVGSLTLTNANRLTAFAAQPAFQSNNGNSARPQVRLRLSNDAATLADDLHVYAEAGATPAFDGPFDAHKLPNTTGLNLAALASGGEALSVQGLAALGEADVVVPLQVAGPSAGPYRLHAAQLANLPAGTRAYLRDAQTGALIDLARHPSYSFALGASGAGGRFSLLFSQRSVLGAAPAALSQQVAVYPNPARTAVWLELPAALRQQAGTVALLNPLGQLVRRFPLAATSSPAARSLSLAGIAPGLYLLSFPTAQGTVVKRLRVE